MSVLYPRQGTISGMTGAVMRWLTTSVLRSVLTANLVAGINEYSTYMLSSEYHTIKQYFHRITIE